MDGAPVLVLAFSGVINMIPGAGSLRVSLQPLVDVQHSTAADSP